MADAGRILIIPRGDYNANSTYEKLDLVKYKGTSWLAKKDATGVVPSEGEYWQKIFDLGTANNLTTTAEGFALDARQGKVLDGKIAEINNNMQVVMTEYNTFADPERLSGSLKISKIGRLRIIEVSAKTLVDIGIAVNILELPEPAISTVSDGATGWYAFGHAFAEGEAVRGVPTALDIYNGYTLRLRINGTLPANTSVSGQITYTV